MAKICKQRAGATPGAGSTRLPMCDLDRAGLDAQRGRYARLAADVWSVERDEEGVVVLFREQFDRALLEEALAVEQVCCPFLLIDFDERTRRLRATVRERDQLPALDALAYAFGAADGTDEG